MKRSLFITLFLLLLSVVALAGPAKYYDFPLIGRWQPAEDPMLLDDYGFQDIQNLRKDGNRLRAVSGHTKINTTGASYHYSRNGFHFTKDQPQESHVIISTAGDSSYSPAYLLENRTAIPDAGNFSGTTLYTQTAGATVAQFSSAPGGNMLACNSKESLIWGGNESPPTGLFTSGSSLLASPRDETEAAQNSLTSAGNNFTLGGGNDSSTKLLVQFEAAAGGNIADTSTGGNGGATHGNASKTGDADITNSVYRFGIGSGSFNGTTDYITFSDHADWNLQATDFCIDMWVRLATAPTNGTHAGLFTQYAGAGDYVFGSIYNDNGTYKILFYSYLATVEQWTIEADWPGIDLSTQFHITFNRSGANIYIWVDGVILKTHAVGAGVWGNIAADLDIGGSANVGYLHGYIDEFRFSNSVARWTTTFTPPDRPYQTDRPYYMIGAQRPIQGFKAYVSSPNIATSTTNVWEWTGAEWTSLTVTDGTSAGSCTLAQTGTISFGSTVATAKPRFFEGQYLYWYKVQCTSGHATISQITVDAPVQSVVDIWSGESVQPIQFQKYEDSIWVDSTLVVLNEAPADYATAQDVLILDSFANTEYLYIGFPQRVTAVKWNIFAGRNNSSETVVSVYYWNGNSWISVGTVTDDTSNIGRSLDQSGWMYWDQPGDGEEFQQTLFGVPAYYYKFMWSVALAVEVEVDTVVGGGAFNTIDGYRFPMFFQGRSFLCSDASKDKNKCIYSSFNAPAVWNGSDAGDLLFGNADELMAGCVIYNVYLTNGIEQAILCKKNETFRVFGDGPENWDVDQVSSNVGCVAPLSMVVCEISDISKDTKRQVAIWQAGHGVVMSDGATVTVISEDIKNYWDVNSSDFIPTDRQADSVGWYDPNLGAYKLLVSSGSGQGSHNVELEYSLKYKEWTKIYRENGSGANPLQCGFQVHDTNGTAYNYGCTDEGYMYRLENGYNWDGTAISQYVQTKDLLLDNNFPLWLKTNIGWIRLNFEDKTTDYGETISFNHYCDGVLTTDGSYDQVVPEPMDMDDGPYETQDVTLGPCLTHSFIITSGSSSIPDGMELNSLGLMFDSHAMIDE